MKHSKIIFLFAFTLILFSCDKSPISIEEEPKFYSTPDEELTDLLLTAANNEGLSYFELPNSQDLNAIPEDPKNKLTPSKIELGKFLFHETGLGTNPKNQINRQSYSCASCHHVRAGFQAGIKQSIGEGGIGFGQNGEARVIDTEYGFDFLDIQPIRTMSIVNSGYQEAIIWNGQFGGTGVNKGTEDAWALRSPKEINFLGFEGLESQAIAGLKIHRMHVSKELIENLGYKELFDEAFPDIDPKNRYNDTITGLAIAAYERVVLADQAPFQSWLKGDQNAMTEDQKKGAILFFGKANCVKCHTGPALNTMEFYALGMHDLKGDDVAQTVAQDFFTSAEGRGGFTGKTEDLYKFKVPQLYNLKDSPFYGHGGSFESIKDIITYKNNGIVENPVVPKEHIYPGFQPKGLTTDEINLIADFIEESLHDPNLMRYSPENLPSGNCFPNSDEQSMIDLGCK
ncbi:cytochrome-c peroxidase [Portibacter lacus]|nr:cytochrome c peroxidase [Portibacter lacus]